MRDEINKKIVVFAPHPDDETLGCGGTIAKKVYEGYEVLIVVITDGRYAFLRMLAIGSDPTPEELKEIRKEEVKKASKILGVPKKNVLFLNFEDGMLKENESEAKEKITEILREYAPAEVYFPYEKDFHIDHRVTNRIIRNSIKKLGLKVEKYKYSIFASRSDRLVSFLKHRIVHVDISEFVSLKRTAIEKFRSQVGIISSKQRKPLMEGTERFLKKTEVFYIDK